MTTPLEQLNDDAVLTAAVGYIFVADPDTAPPTLAEIEAFDPAQEFSWGVSIGHTAREDLHEFGFDGGDTETRGTWQKAAMRTVTTEVPVDYVVINLHQFDDTGLGLYYGQASGGTTPGVFAVKDAPTRTVQKAVLIIIVDGDHKVGFCAPKSDIKREDSIELEVDEFAVLPVRATFVKGTHDLFQWISEEINPAAAPAG